MKKLMIALMMVVATSTASFAKGGNEPVKAAAKEVAQTVKTSLGTFSVNTRKATVTKL